MKNPEFCTSFVYERVWVEKANNIRYFSEIRLSCRVDFEDHPDKKTNKVIQNEIAPVYPIMDGKTEIEKQIHLQ